jgi:hypothetical protein
MEPEMIAADTNLVKMPATRYRPAGFYAYTVETPEQVAALPYYYVAMLSRQTGFANPLACTDAWMGGPFTVVGLPHGTHARRKDGVW